jgi:hypothetical protein
MSVRNPIISMTHVRHPVRGKTCVLLGAEFEYESLDCSHFARHYSRESFICVSFPLGTEMFHFPRCPPATYVFSGQIIALHAKGFPHSEISGSKVACHLPGAYRRLLRLSSALHCQVIHRMPLCASTIQASEQVGLWNGLATTSITLCSIANVVSMPCTYHV